MEAFRRETTQTTHYHDKTYRNGLRGIEGQLLGGGLEDCHKTSLIVNTESSYDWVTHRWTVPINVFANQLVTIGKQRVQFGLGPRYFAERPYGGPRWGFRVNMALVFPEHS